MEHVVQIGIGIDDESIKRSIVENAEKQIIDRLYCELRDVVFKDYIA